VLQFLLDLSDRQATEAARCRIDFKYALDLALARLKQAGLVRERPTQRTDSTHVLAAVRDLTRLELVTEAVRAAPEEVAHTAGHLLVGLVDEDWGRPYSRPMGLGKNPTRPKTRILAAGQDACQLLEHLYRNGPGYRPGPQAEAFRQIIVQNYYRDEAGRQRWRAAEDGGLPPSSLTIVSSYDTTARYVRHGHIIAPCHAQDQGLGRQFRARSVWSVRCAGVFVRYQAPVPGQQRCRGGREDVGPTGAGG
jgi:hypothetical protein